MVKNIIQKLRYLSIHIGPLSTVHRRAPSLMTKSSSPYNSVMAQLKWHGPRVLDSNWDGVGGGINLTLVLKLDWTEIKMKSRVLHAIMKILHAMAVGEVMG